MATYAQIAVIAGFPGQPRLVGYALNALSETDTTPWHRVLNVKGEISPRAESWWVGFQRSLLEREGIRFTVEGKVSLARYQWKPRGFFASKEASRRCPRVPAGSRSSSSS